MIGYDPFGTADGAFLQAQTPGRSVNASWSARRHALAQPGSNFSLRVTKGPRALCAGVVH
jgi:hypothetical protein